MTKKYEKGDFVKVEFDIYANGKLVQTTDKKKAEKENIKVSNFGPQTIILGKDFILSEVEKNIYENQKEKDKLELPPEKAYGKRDRKLIRTFPEKVFKEQKVRPVVGLAYDFNGMIGIVKAVSGGRVMVDFNNPLAGKDIVFEYKVVEKIEKDEEKIKEIFKEVLKLPENMYNINKKDEKVIISVPKELLAIKDNLIKTITELVPTLEKEKIEVIELKLEKKKEN